MGRKKNKPSPVQVWEATFHPDETATIHRVPIADLKAIRDALPETHQWHSKLTSIIAAAAIYQRPPTLAPGHYPGDGCTGPGHIA